MELVLPSQKYLRSYLDGCKKMWGHIHDNYIIHNPDEFDEWKNRIFEEYENNSKGINLPQGFVPHITYWVIEDEKYIGTVNIRLQLSPQLYEYGGMCGVVLVPEYRGKGYGLKLAALSFEKMKELNISPIILTCEEDNEPSKRILEHFQYIKKELYETFLYGKMRKVRRYTF
ncbi:MAG: GNAT family N-acetyltransferase [bacterium]|nr:GNAT family N-acetyltransferase [bacterium]